MENEIINKYTKLIAGAMKSRNVTERETYKFIKAKLMEFVTQKNAPELNESAEIQILNKMVKELSEERDNNIKAQKTDRVNELNGQIDVVTSLLPKAASEDDIKTAVEEYINEHGTITQKEMGMVMSYLKNKFINMDGKMASTIIRSMF